MQVASYLTGFVVVWACFAAVTLLGMFVADMGSSSLIRLWAGRMNMDHDLLTFLCCLMLNLPWLAVYLAAFWRGTAAAQYANR